MDVGRMYGYPSSSSKVLRLKEDQATANSYGEALPSDSEDMNVPRVADEATYPNGPPPAWTTTNPTEALIGEFTRWGPMYDSPGACPMISFLRDTRFSGTSVPLSPGWQERVIRESRNLMQNYGVASEMMDLVSADTTSKLTAEEENAICAVVPKLVRVSMNGPVRGVYLDRSRALWRANWREGGRVKTQGFRIAKWGTYGARRKAIEVRKLMETRACFLRLKAVAYGLGRAIQQPDTPNMKAECESESNPEPPAKKHRVRARRQAPTGTRTKRVRRLL